MNDQSTPDDEPVCGYKGDATCDPPNCQGACPTNQDLRPNNPRPYIPYHNEAIDKLADYLIHEGLDLPDTAELLHGVMTPIDFEHLCQKIEICEIHFCDYRICQDDQDNCPSGAEAKVGN